MRLRFEDLGSHLAGALKPVYVLSGPEPLLLQEAADAIRLAARGQGYDERERFDVMPGFDWSRLDQAGDSPSLFGSRRLLEVAMDSGKPGKDGSAALVRYAGRPPEDAILLLRCGQLDKASERGAWLKALESVGVRLHVWRFDRRRLLDWLRQRMHRAGLRPDREAVALIAERVEGNLLAAAQEVEKLRILNGVGNVTAASVRALVGDSARYDVFDLVDAALAGDCGRASRVLQCIREEGVEPTLVAWALTREVRSLYRLGRARVSGGGSGIGARAIGGGRKREALVQGALRRLALPQLALLLEGCARCDRVIKGQAVGRPWEELLQLALALAGTPPLRGHGTGMLA